LQNGVELRDANLVQHRLRTARHIAVHPATITTDPEAWKSVNSLYDPVPMKRLEKEFWLERTPRQFLAVFDETDAK